ncbi:orotidine-5'-phosphate decarboxylase [Prochlorococcus sp. MIT 1223]|uniref:orotidine-5'-phosphate decarboxylase n=1 Tax=Prochlorococcus sp. MIT 1223 TaxID=3096217 RepID=UPI002A75E046|nr:orotidine-5'-phosphate decarboxylase [Prochlorococcus sp. MIT 1223]
MSNTSKSSEKIILALDSMDPNDSIRLVSSIPSLRWVKVGLELFVHGGPELLYLLREHGVRIFLDLKFHDIPTTMSKACCQAARSGVDLITVHACAGSKALVAAKQGAIKGAMERNLPVPTLLAVTVLTSWNEQSFANELLMKQSIHKRVELMAQLAVSAGMGGCICSPLEVAKLRQKHPDPFQLITPGIRLSGDSSHDQMRTMTPLEAVEAGASKLVVGRSITEAKSPFDAFHKICEELTPYS